MARKRKKAPWLDTRGDRYYAFWYDPDTRKVQRLSLRTDDEGEACNRFAAFLTEGAAITKPRRNDELSVAQALDDYLKEHVYCDDEDGRPNCADPDRQNIAARHLKAFFEGVALAEVDIPMSKRYAAARRAGSVGGDKHGHRKKGGNSTIRRELNVLVAAGNHALRWKRTTQDKMPSVHLPSDTVVSQDEEAPFLTKTELSTLIAAADGELKWFIELAYWTGARRQSILALEKSQVRWDQKRILLQKPSKKATKKRQPIVPILAEMERPLQAVWAASGDRERLFSDFDFYRRFRSLCRRLGYGERSYPHILRHSRATHLLQDGVSLYAVSKLLGDTMETIERVYGHHSTDDLLREIGGAEGLAWAPSLTVVR